MLKRLVVAGDLFRVAPAHGGLDEWPGFTFVQRGNVLWLYHLVRRALARAGAAEPEIWLPPPGDPALRRLLGARDLQAGSFDRFWASTLEGELASDLASYVLDGIGGRATIGFELPATWQRLLTASRIPWVNFRVHPVRFLTDLCLAASSNVPAVDAALRRHVLPHAVVMQSVDRFRACYARHDGADRVEADGTVLFVGQTPVDSALVSNGRVWTPADYADRIERIAAEAKHLLVKLHPVLPQVRGLAGVVTRRVGRAVTEANIYHLLAGSTVERVVTLSSSAGVEARYFEKEVEFLLRDPLPESASGGDLPGIVSSEMLDPAFWRAILRALERDDRGGGAEGPANPQPLRLEPDVLRSTLGERWGFRDVGARPVPLAPRSVSLDPLLALAASDREFVEAAWHHLFWRRPARSDLDYHAARLEGGLAREALLLELLGSDAARAESIARLPDWLIEADAQA